MLPFVKYLFLSSVSNCDIEKEISPLNNLLLLSTRQKDPEITRNYNPYLTEKEIIYYDKDDNIVEIFTFF